MHPDTLHHSSLTTNSIFKNKNYLTENILKSKFFANSSNSFFASKTFPVYFFAGEVYSLMPIWKFLSYNRCFVTSKFEDLYSLTFKTSSGNICGSPFLDELLTVADLGV